MDAVKISRVDARPRKQRSIVGEVELVNTGQEDVFVGAIGVNAPGLRDFSGAPLEQITAAVVVPANRSVAVPIRISLQRGTQPGVYPAAFSVFGSTTSQDIRIDPAEPGVRRGQFHPERVYLQGRPKARVRQTIRLTNVSAVPLLVRKTHGVILHEDLILCNAIQSASRKAGNLGWQKFLDAIVEFYAAGTEDLLRGQISNAPFQLRPGESRESDVSFQLSGDLKPGRSYEGLLEVGGARLPISVDCVTESVGATPADPATPTTKVQEPLR